MIRVKTLMSLVAGAGLLLSGSIAQADESIGSGARAFKQLEEILPSPNVYRDASGAPGPNYWQQEADYKIKVRLDEQNRRIIGAETITYTNNAPTSLRYLWVQLDQNKFNNGSISRRTETASKRDGKDSLSFSALRREQSHEERPYGAEIKAVKDARGNDLKYTIVDTMMRIDLPAPLKTGGQTVFSIDWEHNIIQEASIGGRGGYEWFEENDTYIYFLAQWFPRMAAFTDYTGWQHKQFLGQGEFTLEFGDYDVEITVPSDHIVSSTGVLTNPGAVLTKTQRDRLKQAEKSDKPIYIVTPEEALENEQDKETDLKTWKFSAENVRDFAWSSSRKYIWDAMAHHQEGGKYDTVMAMSFFPNEADPVWSLYSTQAVVHTMDVYSKYSFPYPYPVAQSVNTWAGGGMEYPMITFNGYRPVLDKETGQKTYSRRTKYGLIGVVIHEIGHIYFPMVVNSDERRWTWMDEGLNTFLEYLAEVEWEENFPAFGNKTNLLDSITDYMTSANQVPIMTQSDSVISFGPNAYTKPASALTVLRETVMGREQFDYAFKEYARRWKFKRPTPADFFRTMEDASGVDLDWFWRAWFYTNDHVDIGITDVRSYTVSTQDPEVEFPQDRAQKAKDQPEPLQQSRNREAGIKTRLQRVPALKDMYNDNDEFTVTNKDRNEFNSFLDGLKPWQKRVYEKAMADKNFIYFVDFKNIGGVPSPLPVTLHFEDGSSEDMLIPAEIWRFNSMNVTKMIIRDKKIASVELDRHHQTADADFGNNHFPQQISQSRIKLYKSDRKRKDLMADMLVKLKDRAKAEAKGDDKEVPLTPAN
ncbi:aminopeptidase [Kordiimonas sediminis]|uniref:Aminopeptidase n=1 Tax=Kordiimonas sediminis TaxID=1735581 RepID=A0A919AUC6_9PROT|nr:M1 family metallopeptidase [Kordiimonas sediminis]GHF23936.1 aminopeptidase [Kordiimonas sediminis]